MMRWILDLFWFFRYLQREYWWMRMHRRGTESQTYRLHWTCWRQSMFYQMSNDGTSQIRTLRRRTWMGLYLRVWRRVQFRFWPQNQLIFADWFLVLLSSLLFGLKAKKFIQTRCITLSKYHTSFNPHSSCDLYRKLNKTDMFTLSTFTNSI